jgi:hypothetical protein
MGELNSSITFNAETKQQNAVRKISIVQEALVTGL